MARGLSGCAADWNRRAVPYARLAALHAAVGSLYYAEAVSPLRIVFDASGDLNGRGTWNFTQDGDFVDIAFDWNVEPAKPLLQRLTPALRPVFEANQRWAMQQGENSLREELIRYRARLPEDLLDAAEPRGPVEVPVRWIAAGALAVSAIACIAMLRRKSRRTQATAAL